MQTGMVNHSKGATCFQFFQENLRSIASPTPTRETITISSVAYSATVASLASKAGFNQPRSSGRENTSHPKATKRMGSESGSFVSRFSNANAPAIATPTSA